MKVYMQWLMVIAVAIAGCRGRHPGKQRPSEDDRLPRLETVQPEFHDKLPFSRKYLATVDAFEKIDLCAQVRGQVKTIAKDTDIGKTVTPEITLIELEIPDVVAERDNKKAMLQQAGNVLLQAKQAIEVAAAETKEAEVQIQRYQADVSFRMLKQKRVEELVAGKTLSPQMKEEADLELKSSQAALEAARAQVLTKQARHLAAMREKDVADSKVNVAKAELDRLAAMVNFATLKSPFPAAIITKRWVDSGATIKDPGMPILTLQRIDKVRVLVDIPERDVPYVRMDLPAIMDGKAKTGNPVVITIPALKVLNKEVLQDGKKVQEDIFKDATITLKADALDPVTRTMRAEVHLDNKKGTLKPNMTGTAEVTLANLRKVFTVPSSALVRSGSKVEIFYIADPKGTPPRGLVKRMDVVLGLDDGKKVEIAGEKLTGKEWVIVRGSGVIRAGDNAISVPAKKEENP